MLKKRTGEAGLPILTVQAGRGKVGCFSMHSQAANHFGSKCDMSCSFHAEPLIFYTTHSAVTDPGDHAELYDLLPKTIGDVSKTLHHILLQHWKAAAEEPYESSRRCADIEIRPIAKLLSRIRDVDTRSWDHPRLENSRVLVDCRHFATLLCSVLRHRGIPARVRHGFASYLEYGHNQSHVVCEYWDEAEARWVVADPDTLQHDVSTEQFTTADAVWRALRMGGVDPMLFGYGPDLRGSWCVRWEVVRDLAALNKQEMLTFDIWGMNAHYGYNQELSLADAALLDHIAALLADGDRHLSVLNEIYATSERLRVPPVIITHPYTTGIRHSVDLLLDGSMRL